MITARAPNHHRASPSPLANFPGVAASMEEVVSAIEEAAPTAVGRITWTDERLPFPSTLEAARLEGPVGPVARTSLTEGVRQTVEHFRARAS